MIRAIAEAEYREGRIKAIDLTEDIYRKLDRVYPQMFEEKSKLLKNA